MKLGMCGFTIGAAAYFKQFPVVELQQTFYDPPPLEPQRAEAGGFRTMRRRSPRGRRRWRRVRC